MSEEEPVQRRVAVPGSYRGPLPHADVIGPLADDEHVELTVVLRRRAALPAASGIGPFLTPDELTEQYGADPADVAVVTAGLTALGIDVIEVNAGSRRIRVAAEARTMSAVFGAALVRVRQSDPVSGRIVEHRLREGALSLPAELAAPITAVLGLDDRPQSRTRFRIAPAAEVTTSYTPPELGRIYDFPDGTDGGGQTVAIIELGGGFARSDVDTYFGGLGIATPAVRAVGVDGARNVAGQDPSGADGEVLLDIEVAGALAPRAEVVVYFAPNTDAGFLDAVSIAAHARPTPTAISISWGQSEDEWTAQARTAMDDAMADAAALGVTVTAAAGDDGSSDRSNDRRPHADFPASSPHVLACGGTTLDANPASATISSETVWNNGPGAGATGGGVSDAFALPQWQLGAGVPTRAGGEGGRGLPDVAADADPRTGYQVYVDGRAQVIGGTSAVAPLWAALVCRLAQAVGRPLGLLQPAVYGAAQPGQPVAGFRDITVGDNGAHRAGAGWDACTGLGVPDGGALLATLRQRSSSA